MSFLDSSNNKNILSKIWNLVDKKFRLPIFALFLLMAFGMLLEMLSIALVIPILGLLSDQNIIYELPFAEPLLNSIGNPEGDELIIFGFIFLIAVYLFKTIFLTYQNWQQTFIATEMTASLSQKLYSIYQNQSWVFHLNRNSAQLIQNVMTEINHLMLGLVLPSIILISEVFILLGVSILIIYVEPILSIFIIIFVFTVVLLFYLIFRKPLLNWGEKRQYHDRYRMQNLQQGLGGIKNIIVYNKEKAFYEDYKVNNFESAKYTRYLTFFSLVPRYLFELLAVIIVSFICFYLLASTSYSSNILPKIGFFAVAGFRLLPSINRINTAITSIRFMYPVIDLLNREVQLKIEKEDNSNTKNLAPMNKKLQFSNISYKYPNSDNYVLDRINFEVKTGETIGIIGESGSGKTTIVDICLGLLKVSDGSVKIDDQPVDNNIRSWQKQIGYVPQEIFLIDSSIKENIAFGETVSKIDLEKLNKAIKLSNLENYISNLKEGIETMVGERGIRLSGGQKQRIGIARALYRDPRILIFDEATSALDNANEEEVLESIRILNKKTTTTMIIIAHNAQTLKYCDKIYQLRDKKILPPLKYSEINKTNLINEKEI